MAEAENLLNQLREQSKQLKKRSGKSLTTSDSSKIAINKRNYLEKLYELLTLLALSKYLEKVEKEQAVKIYCFGPFTSSSAFLSPWKDVTNTQNVLKQVRDYVDKNEQ